MYDEIKPSKKRVRKNVAALTSLIETEESIMTKRKFRLKPLIVAAVIAAFSAASLITVNAATNGGIVKFFMGDKEIEGEHYDYVDEEGFRHISFDAVLPVHEDSFAIIYDVDAPQDENVRVLTEENNPDFIKSLRLYIEEIHKHLEVAQNASEETENPEEFVNSPSPKPEDFGIILKDSEICIYTITNELNQSYMGTTGGEFLNTGKAAGKPAEFERAEHDLDNETKTYHHKFSYYVGKEE